MVKNFELTIDNFGLSAYNRLTCGNGIVLMEERDHFKDNNPAEVSIPDSSLAFADLIVRYRPLLISLTSRFNSEDNHAEHEDIWQEAVFALYKAIKSYNSHQTEVSFGLYAKICINNTLTSRFRREKEKHKEFFSLDELNELDFLDAAHGGYEGTDPSELLIRKEKVELLLKEVYEKLSEYEIAVFHLYIDGHKPSDIANLLGKSEKSVNNAIHRFKDKLRQLS